MILSMTGYGKASMECAGKKFTAEIKSLNSKQLDLSIRIPQQYKELELQIRSMVAQRLERGKADIVITVETISSQPATSINLHVAASYKHQIEALSRQLDIPMPEDWISTLIKLPDVLHTEIEEINEEESEAMFEVVRNAIEGLMEFRTQEGNRLDAFFREKIEKIQNLLNEVPQYEADRLEKIKARIQDSLSKLGEVDYDKNRFEQEMIFYIEKLDIAEEKLRLQNHLDYFITTMDGNFGQGKKLGFISQEMGREINTLGSKANQAELQKIVVRMKDQLEQIKEQVLNVM